MPEPRKIPTDLEGPLRLYRALFPALAALLAPGVFLRMRRRGGYRENMGQRFGRFTPDLQSRASQSAWTWIHSISVGETLVALKLARALRSARPDICIALSATTSTGYALAREAECEWLMPLYNPVDYRGAVRGTLDFLRPQRLILIEGEAWPNLLAECYCRRIPVMLANARLSPRSARRFAKFRRWCGPVFNLLEWIGVADAEDFPLWENIGIDRGKLRLTGSIKFDQTAQAAPGRAQELRAVLRRAGISEGAPLLVAGSTHAGEEVLLARMFAEWRAQAPGLRIVLVPRHVERTAAIVEELAPLGLRIRRRSEFAAEPATANADGPEGTDILIVDCTGELRDWYALATVIFVGKSLRGGGGQNPVEAALCGKPVLFGPLMGNFQTVVSQLTAAGGALCVPDEEGLKSAILGLLCDEEQRARLGRNAHGAVASHQGAAERTAQLILDTDLRPIETRE